MKREGCAKSSVTESTRQTTRMTACRPAGRRSDADRGPCANIASTTRGISRPRRSFRNLLQRRRHQRLHRRQQQRQPGLVSTTTNIARVSGRDDYELSLK